MHVPLTTEQARNLSGSEILHAPFDAIVIRLRRELGESVPNTFFVRNMVERLASRQSCTRKEMATRLQTSLLAANAIGELAGALDL